MRSIFIDYMHYFLETQQLDYRIFIIEQVGLAQILEYSPTPRLLPHSTAFHPPSMAYQKPDSINPHPLEARLDYSPMRK